MRILLIHQYFLEPDDGGGSRFNEMSKQWTNLGHDITVIAGMMHANGSEKRREYKGKYFVKKNQDDVEVIRCHVSEAYNKGFLGRLWGYFSFVFSGTIAGLFKTNKKYDLILVTSPPLFVGIIAYILSIVKRIPFVFEVRDLWPESAIDTGVLTNKITIKMAYSFEKFIYKKAKLINVLTPAFRKTLIENKKVPEEKVVFIPNAADFSISDAILKSDFNREKFRSDNDLTGKIVITYVGAHGVANHLIQVLETADLLRTRPNILFLLIGDGMEKESLMKEAIKRKLNNVKFLPPVSKKEVFKYIIASDFGMSVLKKVDTFKTIYSNKTFDYMACKRPIFMVIDGVSRDLVNDAQCGLFVEPENPAGWVSKIETMLEYSADDIMEMGDNGYTYAKEHFDRSTLADKYLKALQNLIT